MKNTFAVKTAAWQAHPCNENLEYLNYEIIEDINETPAIKGRQQFYKYPLRCGAYSLTYEEAPAGSLWHGGLFSRLGDLTTEPATADEPLDAAQKKMIIDICDSGDIKYIGRKLSRYNHGADVTGYTWVDVYNDVIDMKSAADAIQAVKINPSADGDKKKKRKKESPVYYRELDAAITYIINTVVEKCGGVTFEQIVIGLNSKGIRFNKKQIYKRPPYEKANSEGKILLNPKGGILDTTARSENVNNRTGSGQNTLESLDPSKGMIDRLDQKEKIAKHEATVRILKEGGIDIYSDIPLNDQYKEMR